MCVCGIDSSEEMVKWLPPINMATDIRVPMQREILRPTERLIASPLQIIHTLQQNSICKIYTVNFEGS